MKLYQDPVTNNEKLLSVQILVFNNSSTMRQPININWDKNRGNLVILDKKKGMHTVIPRRKLDDFLDIHLPYSYAGKKLSIVKIQYNKANSQFICKNFTPKRIDDVNCQDILNIIGKKLARYGNGIIKNGGKVEMVSSIGTHTASFHPSKRSAGHLNYTFVPNMQGVFKRMKVLKRELEECRASFESTSV